jgi:hypothetical protein
LGAKPATRATWGRGGFSIPSRFLLEIPAVGRKGGPLPGAHFGFAGMVAETVLLGNVALRAGKELEWDGVRGTITNVPDANSLLRSTYREGWGI